MKFFLVLLASASICAMPAGAARAQDPLPKPMPCVGEAALDKTNDLLDLSPVPPFGPNTDIKSFFFRSGTDAAGKTVVTANLVIADLTKTNYERVGSIEWQVVYDLDDFTRVATAQLTPDGSVKFYDGTFFLVDSSQMPPLQGLPGASTGRFLEGKDGVVEIVLNGSDALKGKTLKSVYARTKMALLPIPQQGPAYVPDRAPDAADKFGKDFVVQDCPAEAPAEQGTDTTAAPDQGQPQQQPQQQPAQQQQPQQPQQQPGSPAPGSPLPATGTLTFDVAVDKGKRKTALRRGLRGRVRCSVQCKVTATARVDKRTARKLKLGRKAITIGKGKASIEKAGRIPFYVKMTKKAKRALKRKGVKKFALKVAFRVTDNQGKQVKKVTRKATLR